MNLILSNLLMNWSEVAICAALLWIFCLSRREILWREAYRRLGKNPLAIATLAILGLYASVTLLDSIAWQSSAIEDPKSVVDRIFDRVPERSYSPPFGKETVGEASPHPLLGFHLLGTDAVGQDIFYRTLKGFKTVFILGGFSCLIAVPIAILVGLSAGYFGRRVDDVLQYIYTVFGSIPDILLIIALVLMLGKNIFSICLALGLTSWTGLCRLIRGETLKHREREYVRAAKALGVSDGRILFHHILPNVMPNIIIMVTQLFSAFALYETVLSYLGVGLPLEAGSWGNMIDSARDELTRDPVIWWNLASAAGALLIFVLCMNLLADALRDAIDPRLRTQ